MGRSTVSHVNALRCKSLKCGKGTGFAVPPGEYDCQQVDKSKPALTTLPDRTTKPRMVKVLVN